MSGPVEFLPDEIVRVLLEHDVDFIVIGGLAAQAHESAMLTQDIDITPEMSIENLDRGSQALTVLNARIRHPQIPEGLPFGHDGTSLAAAVFWVRPATAARHRFRP